MLLLELLFPGKRVSTVPLTAAAFLAIIRLGELTSVRKIVPLNENHCLHRVISVAEETYSLRTAFFASRNPLVNRSADTNPLT